MTAARREGCPQVNTPDGSRPSRRLPYVSAGAGLDLELGTLDFWRGTLGVSFRF